MVTIIFVLFAALFSACMDKVETTIAFKTSVFYKLNPSWWCKPISAHYINFIPYSRYRPDFWHLCKSGMVWCYLLAVVLYKPIFCPLIDFVGLGFLYILTFDTFYDYLLTKEFYLKIKSIYKPQPK